ncbi:MAG: DNA polymerase, partial [Bacillota bacterium]
MMTLAIDLETYSSADLTKTGVYGYTQAPDFEILLLAYAWDDGPVEVIDLAQGEAIPAGVLAALTDTAVLKTAWNAQFERTALARHLGQAMPPEQWRCSMVHSYTLGLPGSLDLAAKAVGVEVQKDSAGSALIRFFCRPCKPTKTNGGRTRNLPQHDPEKWAQFVAYCRQDVEVERAVRTRMQSMPVPEIEQMLWELDQRINDFGVRVDQELVAQAVACDQVYSQRLVAEAAQVTGLDNPNSVAQLKRWVEERAGEELDSLDKEAVKSLLKRTDDDAVRQALSLRQEMAKASVAKYQAIQQAVCPDGRVRGLLQFYGASRTGRWAGRLVQVQNLPRNSLVDLDVARGLLRDGFFDALELLYDAVPDVLSQLVRTAFVPSPGHRLIVADFSAIEARVIAWLAGEQWRLDVFSTHGKIYEASAAQMFGVPVESIDKHSPLRQKGKIAELALGYQGGPGALINMGALEMGLQEDELPDLVQAWRAANPRIVQFWYDVGRAALEAVQQRTTVRLQHGLSFIYGSGILRIQLPSGRHLCYVRPRIEMDPAYGRPGLTYEGQNQGRWVRERTYGGKLV